MRKMLVNTAVALLLWACGGDSGPDTGPSGPSTPNITGTFAGFYTASVAPGFTIRAVFELTHVDTNVSGTLSTNVERFASFSGTVSGTRLTGVFTFTDDCVGTASATADITNNGTRLTGTYTANDCNGGYTGDFLVDKQSGNSTRVTATGPSPAHLLVKNGRLFWSESGANPVNAISPVGGSSVVLAQQIGVPTGVAVWGQDLFWLDEGSGGTPAGGCTGPVVGRILKKTPASGGMTTVLAPGDACAGGTTDLVVDATHVYWVTSTASPNTYVIRKTPLSGGSSTSVRTTSIPIVALIADAGNLYWMENRFPDPVAAIQRVPKSGVGGSPDTLASGFTSRATTFAVNSASVFYTESNFPSSENLIEVPLAGGSPIPRGTLAETPRKLIADDTHLYWIDGAAISALPLAGGSPVVLANAVTTPIDLVLRGNDVVWSETTGPAYSNEPGAVKGVPKTGGPVFVFAQREDAPGRLSVDASWVYWAEGSFLEGVAQIARVPAGGGAVETVVSGVAGRPPITVSDTHVFIADRWRIKGVPVSGGTLETLAAASFYIRSIVTDGAYVYWLEGGPFAIVRKVSADGGPVTTLGSGGGDPAGPIRVDATHVYWMGGENAIFRVPKDGGNVTTLVGPVPGLLTDFLVDGGNVYFSEWDGGRIRKTPVTGGEVSTLASLSPDQTRRLATDGLSVYWIDQGGVGKAPTTGGAPSHIVFRLAADPLFAASIVADATSIYWTEPPIRQIRKALK